MFLPLKLKASWLRCTASLPKLHRQLWQSDTPQLLLTIAKACASRLSEELDATTSASGLLITNYKGRAVIAFAIGASHVTVIGIYYGGLGYEEILNET